MTRLFATHDDYSRDPATGRRLTQAERIARSQELYRAANPPSPPSGISARYQNPDGSLIPRSEREAAKAAEARADAIVEHEAERRIALASRLPQKPQSPTRRWLSQLHPDWSRDMPGHRGESVRRAEAEEAEIDAAWAADRERRERENETKFVEARQHAAEFLASLPEAFHVDAKVALAVLDRIDSVDGLSLYWSEVGAVRAKADVAKAAALAERQREVNEAAARLDAHFAEMRQHQDILAKEAQHGGASAPEADSNV